MSDFQQITFNGETFDIPNPHAIEWGQKVTDFLVAIPNGVLQPDQGTFTLTEELDFGTLFGIKAKYFKSESTPVAETGVLRLGKDDTIVWRNVAGTDDNVFAVDSNDALTFNGDVVLIGQPIWGSISGTLSNQTDLQAALDAKQDDLGFTPENVANKSDNTSLGSST